MDNLQITKKQHYVPEFLLKNFCSSDGKFAAYNIQYKSYSRKSPAQVCYKDFLYETRNNNDEFILCNEIEKYFSEKEKEYSDCINDVLWKTQYPYYLTHEICTINEIETLYSFAANLIVRNPYTMNLSDCSDLVDDIKKSKEYAKISALVKRCDLGSADNILQAAFQKYFLDDRNESGTAALFIDEIKNLNFLIWISPNNQFVTSTFPIAIDFFEDKAFRKIIIPLSPHCTVLFHEHETNNVVRLINDEQVIEINKLISNVAMQGRDFLFAKDKKAIEELIQFIGEKNE